MNELDVERRPGGVVHVRAKEPLAEYPRCMTERLEYWAERAPQRILFAQRDGKDWRSVTYGQALDSARRIGAALLERGLSAERPLAVLSGNDIEHGLLHLGAMLAGIPYAPISPAYSLLSHDFGKLRAVLELLTPGLVFASDRRAYARAIDALGLQAIHDVPEAE